MTGYWFLPLIFQLKARNEPSIRLTDCVAFHPCSTFTHVLWLSHQCLPTSLPSLAQAWPFDVVWPGKHEQKCVVTSGRGFLVPLHFLLKGGVICISEVIDISPGNLDSSLCFFQPRVCHDVLCIEVK